MNRKSAIHSSVSAAWVAMGAGLAMVAATFGYAGAAQNSPPFHETPLEHQLEARAPSARADIDPVDHQLARYSRRVPEMGFLRLYGKRAAGLLATLPGLLGDGAENMDYEHDASARSTLIDLQMHRIGVMLREGLPSTTLFKVGQGAALEHRYLCVVTLDTAPFRRDPHYASRFLAPADDTASSAVREEVLMDNDDFLKFAVDHEVFHCLDAYFNGPPIKKTRDELFSHYQAYRNEARADAFAVGVYKAEITEPYRFLEALAALRTLSLLDGDLIHYTGPVIRRAMREVRITEDLTLMQMVSVSRRLADDVIPSPSTYASRVADVAQLMEHMGRDPSGLLAGFEDRAVPRHSEIGVARLFHEINDAQRIIDDDPLDAIRRKTRLSRIHVSTPH